MFATPILLALLAVPDAEPLQRLGRFESPTIREASGIVKSRRHPGIFWVHNDSGNPPSLFAVRADGTTVREFAVAVPNVDWEDVAIDDDGHLYIGEIGNNGNRLPIRAIYRLDEPDPTRPADGPLPVTLASFYRFPPGDRFDAESLVVTGGRAIVIAKTFDRREAELFAIPLDPPAPLLRPALPKRLGFLPKFREPATGADLSVDGRELAVCANDVTRVYEQDAAGIWKLAGTVRYRARDIEAICWDGADLVLASEGGELYRIAERTWRASP